MGGFKNYIKQTSPYCTKELKCNTIVGGAYNLIQSSDTRVRKNFIGGGCNNRICAITGVGADYNSILGGRDNTICGYSNAHIIGSSLTASSNNTTFVEALSKTSGTFRIKHPDPIKNKTHYLQHSFVESPTAGDNIYRYVVKVVDGVAEIELPDYFKFLNENTQIWVTPKKGFGIAYGEVNADLTKATIFANEDLEYNVLIIGTRKDKDAIKGWNGVEILHLK